ncbi:beta-N-acetylhexosaminidase [Candidatus Poribacteria bacterium]|nr:beta-N-acetylhexosaminidase [Candidatus Poribacteria bacterium]
MKKLSDKAGELFMVGYAGTDPTAASELIRRHHVGGIILFSRNVKDAAHTWAVCKKLQELRREVSDTPLFIAIDQEGGCVARITEGVTVFPGNMALGATGSESFTRGAGRVMAGELARLGINVNFAPVLDISSNPRNPGVGARSFSSDPALVARLSSAMIRAMQEDGLCATAKHFPGLGEAKVDSHDELPVVDAAVEIMEGREFLPFYSAIEAGVAFIMTAHCAYPRLDRSGAPATLSEPILTGLLRKRMGFKGIVITDCLEMAGVEKTFTPAQSALKAAAAGANILLICHTREKQVAAIEALARSIEADPAFESAIGSSLEVISSAKNRLTGRGDAASPEFGREKNLSESIAVEATTIVRNEGPLIPLKLASSETLAVIVPGFEALTKVEENAEPQGVLVGEIKQRHPRLEYHTVAVNPTPDEMLACSVTCRSADVILILTYNLHQYPAQRDLVHALLALGKPSIVAAVRDPYDLGFIPQARACVATYSFRECSLKALVRVLFGESEARGKLPVKLG